MYQKRKDTLSFSDMYHITLFNKSCCCTRDGFTWGGGGGGGGLEEGVMVLTHKTI